MAIKTITLAELKDMPGMTEEELERFNAIKDIEIDVSDIPRLTEEQLKNAKRLRDVHPEWFEELEDLQDAIQISKEIKEGKMKTYTLDEIKKEFSSDNHYSDEIINRWGMTNIYRSRSEMNADCSKDLDKALEHIDYIGFGFRSLMDSKSKIIEEKAVAGVKIRFLVMDPESPYLKKREAIEKSSEGSIKQSIYNLEKWIRHLREISKNPSNIQLRYYDSFPLDFYNRIDDAIYMGPYWFGKTSQQTVSYRFQAKSEGYNLYTEYFNDLWDSTDLKTRDALARRNK